MCGVAEYDELPVRHNEDKINTALSGEVRWPIDSRSADDPHAKANLLLQVSPASVPSHASVDCRMLMIVPKWPCSAVCHVSPLISQAVVT